MVIGVNLYGSVVIRTNMCESVQICECVCTDLCGFVRIYVDLYEVVWHGVYLCIFMDRC